VPSARIVRFTRWSARWQCLLCAKFCGAAELALFDHLVGAGARSVGGINGECRPNGGRDTFASHISLCRGMGYAPPLTYHASKVWRSPWPRVRCAVTEKRRSRSRKRIRRKAPKRPHRSPECTARSNSARRTRANTARSHPQRELSFAGRPRLHTIGPIPLTNLPFWSQADISLRVDRCQNVLCFSPDFLHMYGTRTCP
jgi:hypothetical protein